MRALGHLDGDSQRRFVRRMCGSRAESIGPEACTDGYDAFAAFGLFAHIYCLLASMLSSGETSRHPVDILHLRPLFSLLARSTRIVYIEGCTVSTSTDRS